MIDHAHVLARLDDPGALLRELRSVAPARVHEYLAVEKRRACERLLEICVQAVVDVCALLVSGFRLGVPAEEEDLFEKLIRHGALSASTAETRRRMKGLRNLLVHGYGRVNDEIVFEAIRDRLGDFEVFKREVLAFLRGSSGP